MSKATLRVGIIGAGSMGALHARTITKHPRSELTWVHDSDFPAAQAVAYRYGSSAVNEPLFGDVDAVVVASSTPSHFTMASEVLAQGLPVLVEKPLCERLEQVESLIASAERLGIPLRCGFIERFNPAVRTAMDLVREPIMFRSTRHSPHNSRVVSGVGSDLLIHDIDIAVRLFGEAPIDVTAMCSRLSSQTSQRPEEIAEAILRFSDNRIAQCSASLRSHRKIRRISITEPDRLIEIDLVRLDLTIYRHIEESAALDDLGYRQQTVIEIPVLQHHGEPLMVQWDTFVRRVADDIDDGVTLESLLLPHRLVDTITSDHS